MEFVVGAGCVAEDVSDGHEEREEGVGGPRLAVVPGGEVTEEGAAWTLEHVVGHVQDPEADHKDHHRAWTGLLREVIARRVSYIGCIADEEHSNCDGDGSDEDEGTAATKAGSASVAAVPYNGLHKQPRDWAAEPNERRPCVRDAEGLDVRCQKREL